MQPLPPTRRGFFTATDYVIFISIFTCVIIGGFVFQNKIGGRYSWLVGAVLGFFVIPIIAAIWALTLGLVKDGFPMLPTCRNGKCRERDYEQKYFVNEFNWVCKCGDRYKRCGRRFMFIDGEGKALPYKIWKPFRGWYRDTQHIKILH